MILDESQQIISDRLKSLHNLIEESQKNSNKFWFLKFFSSQNNQKIKSFYIYGDVGRGKSMLAQKFYKNLKNISKIHFHFNDFMNLIHLNLKEIRDNKISQKFKNKKEDEVILAVKKIIKNNKLIYFDEFQVVDIADAMLLSKIFSYIFEQNIIVVFTSNSHPLDLYKNGLQRQVFLKFVKEVLLINCEVLHLDSKIDYRKNFAQNLSEKYLLRSVENEKKFQNLIEKFTNNKDFSEKIIKIWGRNLKIAKSFESKSEEKFGKKIAVINFDEIFRANYGAADYQAISKNFDLIFLENLPVLSAQDVNEARRFVLFIDEIYENKVALIILAEGLASEIYKKGIGFEAFERTVSRLREIASDAYFQKSKFIFIKDKKTR